MPLAISKLPADGRAFCKLPADERTPHRVHTMAVMLIEHVPTFAQDELALERR